MHAFLASVVGLTLCYCFLGFLRGRSSLILSNKDLNDVEFVELREDHIHTYS